MHNQDHEPGCRSQKSEHEMEEGGGLGLGGGTLQGDVAFFSALPQALGDRAPRELWKRQRALACSTKRNS